MIAIDLLTSAKNITSNSLLEYDSPFYSSLKKAVHKKDNHTCQSCQFKAQEYQSILALNSNIRDIENLVTVCIFCQQCFQLDKLEELESGILIWLPEFTQVELNRLARILFMGSFFKGEHSEKYDFYIEQLANRQQVCIDKTGISSPKEFLELVKDSKKLDSSFINDVQSLRLLPTQKRMLKHDSFSYNILPQILESWKEEVIVNEKQDNECWSKLAELFYSEESYKAYENQRIKDSVESNTESSTETKKTTIADITAKLLRDAANFFINLANENIEIEREMKENASVFEQMADLLEKEPLGTIDNRTHASLAAQLLNDAATFFDTLADQNDPIREQLRENAKVFRQVAERVENNPTEVFSHDSSTDEKNSETVSRFPTLQWTIGLLRHGSTLLGKLKYRNTYTLEEIQKYIDIMEDMALLLHEDSKAITQGKSNVVEAVKLLHNSAILFHSFAEQNETMKQEMLAYASVYKKMAYLLNEEPYGYL